jgi:hypothetical protein
MAKKRKFAEGGSPDMDVADDIANESFSAAFKRNREGGNKTFEWRGKKYTTEMAKSEAKPKPKDDMDEVTVSARRSQNWRERKASDNKAQGEQQKAKEASDKNKAQKASDAVASKTRADAYSSQLARESAARSNPYGTPSMYKKGGKIKKYAEGGNVNFSANEVSRMKPATPENTKRLQERARRAGASEAAIDRATRGVISKMARGGGIESRGKTRGKMR